MLDPGLVEEIAAEAFAVMFCRPLSAAVLAAYASVTLLAWVGLLRRRDTM